LKYLKKILKVLGLTAVILLFLVALGGYVLLRWPQLVFNDRSMRALSSFAGRFGAVVTWDQGKFEVQSPGLLHKQIAVDLDRLCFNLSENRQQGCLGKLSLAAEIAWRDGGLKILELGPLTLAEGDASLQIQPGNDNTPLDLEKIALPEIFQATIFKPIHLQLKKFDLKYGDTQVSTAGTLGMAADARGKPNHLEAQLDPSCIEFSEGKSSACLKKLGLSAEVSWKDSYLRLTHLGPLLLEGGELELATSKSSPPKPEEEGKFSLDLPPLVLPEVLRDTTFERVSLAFDRIQWGSDQDLISGKLQIASEPSPEGQLGDIAVDASLAQGLGLAPSQVQATLRSPSHFRENDWNIDGGGRIGLRDGTVIGLTLSLHPEGKKVYGFRLNADSNFKKIPSRLAMSGELGEGRLRATLEGSLAHPASQIEKVTFSACGLDFRQISRKNDLSTLALDCPVQVDVPKLRLPDPAFDKYVSVPTRIKLKVKTDLRTTFFPSLDKRASGTLNAQIDTLTQDLLAAKGTTRIEFAGVPSRYPRDWKLDSQMDLSFLVPSFRKLKQTLEHTAFAIPAPLNVLDGTIELKVQGKADIAKSKGAIPVEFSTRLASTDQSFNTDGKGELNYALGKSGSTSELNLDLMLSDLRISLPHLGYSAIPALFPDGRFENPKKTKVESALPANFKYNIKIKTAPDQPARLVSNLTKENIPIQLDLNANKDRIGGTINVGQAQLDLFRRNAQLSRFKIELADPTDLSVVNGAIRVVYLDYKIDVIVVGTFKRPVVVFQSDPPLEREQIISVLIYGRTFDELNTDKSQSVSAVSAAAADRAIALGSLFLLASTPIESVGYNPATGEFSAKVKLAQGTSLSLGTQEGKTQEVGLKKNIGGNWILNTYFENNSDKGNQSGGALMEWYKRY